MQSIAWREVRTFKAERAAWIVRSVTSGMVTIALSPPSRARTHQCMSSFGQHDTDPHQRAVLACDDRPPGASSMRATTNYTWEVAEIEDHNFRGAGLHTLHQIEVALLNSAHVYRGAEH